MPVATPDDMATRRMNWRRDVENANFELDCPIVKSSRLKRDSVPESGGRASRRAGLYPRFHQAGVPPRSAGASPSRDMIRIRPLGLGEFKWQVYGLRGRSVMIGAVPSSSERGPHASP